MRGVRVLAAFVFAGALVAGSFATHERLQEPPRIGAAWLVSADLHVHAFPGDGLLAPALLRREAARRNLHVIALTNHNHGIQRRLVPRGADRVLPLVLDGEEVTMPAAHLVALGIPSPVPWRTGVLAAIDTILAQGGIAILAHPQGDAESAIGATAFARLTGVEVVNGKLARGEQTGVAVYRTMRALGPRAAVGSSDFHHEAPLGAQRTFLLVSELSERGVLDALRRGRSAVSVSTGWVGDSTVIEAIRSRDRILDRGGPASPTALFAACVVAWLALLALVLRS